jgi:hydrogenase nickel incorporation protein HypB
MCTYCGCSDGETRVEGETPDHGHHHHPGASVANGEQTRLLRLEQNILSKNDAIATHNRHHFAAHRVLTLNLISSPGSGKTTLLVRTLTRLKNHLALAVIEGDQQTATDAERIRATGLPAVQVNTGKGCHLDAQMVARAFANLPPPEDGVLFIENVGNLVCPAGFDLGEAHKVVMVSVTEGEDKPLKYPDVVAASDLLIVSKVDLLPYVDFDLAQLIENARRVKPGIEVVTLSATTGEGLDGWTRWIWDRCSKSAAAAE